jgi:hypothetical protein
VSISEEADNDMILGGIHVELDLTQFEPFMDEAPFRVLSLHPNGLLAALQVVTDHPQAGNTAEFSAIWNIETRSLVWQPEGVSALAWNVDGKEIGLIREHYDYDPTAHVLIGSALQSEFTYTWERLSWPEKELISSCPITIPTGWPEAIAISPRGNLAVFQWFDQGESGLEFLTLTKDSDFQLLDAGLPLSSSVRSNCLRSNGNGYPVGSNLATLPAFSPDGRYLVFGWQDAWAWWADLLPGAYVNNDTLAKVGECHMGVFEIIDWEMRAVRQVPVLVNLPPGWYPLGSGGPPEELMADPEFIDREHFLCVLPAGKIRIYSASE